MEGGSRRAAGVRGVGAGSSHPDWEALPEAPLFKILQKVSKAGGVPHHFLVCKRWLRVAKEAKECFRVLDNWDDWATSGPSWNQREYHCDEVVRTLAQFPNLIAVSLEERGFSDTVLESLSTVCPKLLSLSIGRMKGYCQAADEEEEIRLTSAAGLARAIESLPGLTSLRYEVPFPLPGAVSKLQKLENLEIASISGPLPSGLGALPSLKSLSVGAEGGLLAGHPRITRLPDSCWQLPNLERLTMLLPPGAAGHLPTGLFNLTSLRFLALRVSHTCLPVLEQSLARLSNLEELRLLYPGLRKLPDSLQCLNKLRSLTVDGHSLVILPELLQILRKLLRLEELTLASLGLKLAGGLSCLSARLRSLTLDRYNRHLPYRMGGLTRLEKLCLEQCNEVEYFPDSFTSLVALKELKLRSCTSLEVLPRMLGSCSRLKVLHVEECRQLTMLPEDLGEVPSLRQVILRGLTSLRHLPALVNAKGLTKLSIRGCRNGLLSPGLLDLPSLDEDSRYSLRREMQEEKRREERDARLWGTRT